MEKWRRGGFMDYLRTRIPMPKNRSITTRDNRINPKVIPIAIAILFTMNEEYRNSRSVLSAGLSLGSWLSPAVMGRVFGPQEALIESPAFPQGLKPG